MFRSFLWIILVGLFVFAMAYGYLDAPLSYLLSLASSSSTNTAANSATTSTSTTTSTLTQLFTVKPHVPIDPKWPKAGQTWTNSLGVKMVPAGTDGILFSVYDVRLEDFQEFAKETNLAVSSEHMNGYLITQHANGDGGASANFAPAPNLSWQNPGFTQGPTEPVVGMSWAEIQLFCQWLTNKERAAGLIGPDQMYRLPGTAEWHLAAGNSVYPWGDTWPPPAGAGNYCDTSWENANGSFGWTVLQQNDGYGFTSPVGSFPPNSFGLYDMGGNVNQFSNDIDPAIQVHHLWLGSSWSEYDAKYLRLDYAGNSCGPSYRYNTLGFRVVLDTTESN